MSASTGIYDRMSAWELVEYFGRLYGLHPERLRERMEIIFDWLKMNDFRETLGSKMSTGMKQKVSIARTIVHDPPVLIFDEPTSGLDVLVQRVVLQKILELRDMGKTILFSTHSMHEVEKLCQRVAIIHKGELQVAGEPRELLERFDQPDLEELFFHLVDRADHETGMAEPASDRPAGTGKVDSPDQSDRPFTPPLKTRPTHELVEPVRDFPPRGSRPAPRPAYVVHDLRLSDLALPDPGIWHHPGNRRAREKAPDRGGGGGRVSAHRGAAAEPRGGWIQSAAPRSASGCEPALGATRVGAGTLGNPRAVRAGHS